MTRDFSLPGRSAVHARNGMIATSHPLASAVGLKTLNDGGSAVDAVITAAALLSVAEPHMTGIGGDCFALVAHEGSTDIQAFNGSGAAPKAADAASLRALGLTEIPRHSPHAVTVPGAVDAWFQLHARFGKHDWPRLFEPAASYAEQGLAVHERVARDWGLNAGNIEGDVDSRAQFLDAGGAYGVGSSFRHLRLAEAFRLIAKDGRDAFYRGAIAEDIVSKLDSLGGVHCLADFSGHAGSFVEPIFADYMGHRIWECPPNGQGLAALVLVKILEQFDIASLSEIDRVHLLAEASKIAYHFRDSHIADPSFAPFDGGSFLAADKIKNFASQIDMARAALFAPSDFPSHPHTVYLAAVDSFGTSVSLINSIFDDFGSGISTPLFGILLQSRGRAFSLDAGHPNVLAGGKRPLHTIIPGMVTRGDSVVGAFGVMGGQYQAAGHGMLLSHIFGRGLGVQRALDMPRSFYHSGILQLESGYGSDIAAALALKGHVLDYPSSPIGGGQAIFRDLETGFYVGGSDSRKDGLVIGY